MSSRVLRHPTLPLTTKQFTSMRAKLRKLGFGSMRDLAQGNALKLQVPPDFPGPGKEIMTKSAGRSVARFVFSKENGIWNLELTLSRPSDARSGLLVEAYQEKEHRVNNRTYEATLVPVRDEERAVAHIDDLNVFLAGLDTDREISEAIDALSIKKRVKKMSGQLTKDNSMAADFINYIDGFVTHCDELWAWQVQRLRMDSHARAIMGMLTDKL